MITETTTNTKITLFTQRAEELCNPMACPVRELLGYIEAETTVSYEDVYVKCMEERFNQPMDQIKILTELSSACGPSGVFVVDCPNLDIDSIPGLTCGTVVGINRAKYQNNLPSQRLSLVSADDSNGGQNG